MGCTFSSSQASSSFDTCFSCCWVSFSNISIGIGGGKSSDCTCWIGAFSNFIAINLACLSFFFNSYNIRDVIYFITISSEVSLLVFLDRDRDLFLFFSFLCRDDDFDLDLLLFLSLFSFFFEWDLLYLWIFLVFFWTFLETDLLLWVLFLSLINNYK